MAIQLTTTAITHERIEKIEIDLRNRLPMDGGGVRKITPFDPVLTITLSYGTPTGTNDVTGGDDFEPALGERVVKVDRETVRRYCEANGKNFLTLTNSQVAWFEALITWLRAQGALK